MEPLAESATSLIEDLGEIPCPTDGCDGIGRRVRLFEAEIQIVCDPCEERIQRDEAERERAERIEHLLARAGGTPRLREFTLDGYFTDKEGARARRVVEMWANTILLSGPAKSPNLFLHGPLGCGKTGLMWPVVEMLCRGEVRTKYVDFPTMLMDMKASFDTNVPFHEFVDYARVPVLVVDDVGGHQPTEWSLSELLYLVNQRYEWKLPTAYVTNYSLTELAEKRLNMGDPIVSRRIVDRMGEGAIVHEIKTRSRRR